MRLHCRKLCNHSDKTVDARAGAAGRTARAGDMEASSRSMEGSSSGNNAGRVAAVVRRHYSQLLLRKGKRRRHAVGRRRPAESAVSHGEHATPGEALLLSAQQEEQPEIQSQGRSSAVFEQWWPSPVASPTDRASAVVHKQSCASPLLSLLQCCENLRGYVFERCSLGALHRLCRVCAALRDFSLAYIRERVHRPVVFGGMRRGRWRLADGASSSFSDTCCAEELFWGGSTAWLPVPSLYSRLRLNEFPGTTESGSNATTVAPTWLGVASAFGEWPSTACIDAVRKHTAELRGYAIAYAQLCHDPLGSGVKDSCAHIVIAGGVHVGNSAGSHSRPVAKVVAVSLTCGTVLYLPDMQHPRANFSLSVYPPPSRSRKPRSSVNSGKWSHDKALEDHTGTGFSVRLVVLVAVGGVGELQEPLTSAELFCCSRQGASTSGSETRSASWTELPPMRTARTHPSAACWCWPADNGPSSNLYKVAVFIIGGLSGLGGVLRSTESLSLSLATTATHVVNEADHTASACAGTVCEKGGTLLAVPKIAHSSWVRGPALTTGRFGACVVLVQRRRGEGAFGLERKDYQQQNDRHDDHIDAGTDSGVSDGVMDVLVVGGYSLSSGKLSSVELLDEQAPSPTTSKCRLGQHGPSGTHGSGNGGRGTFLQLAQLSVARSPWSHSSEGVEGASNPIVEASGGDGGSGGSAVVFGITLASVAGREGSVKTTPFKSPVRLK